MYERNRLPMILDIEASGFGKGSYPIEIAVTRSDGETLSWLIKPEDDWVHWSEEAHQLHRISRHELEEKGLSPVQVAMEMNDLLEGEILYSDGWGFDSGWLNLLFYVARKRMYFKLETLTKVMSEFQMEHWDKTKAMLRDKHGFEAHRAAQDAQLLQMTFQQTLLDEQLASSEE